MQTDLNVTQKKLEMRERQHIYGCIKWDRVVEMSETLEVIRRREGTSRKKKLCMYKYSLIIQFGTLLKEFDGPGQMLLLGSAGATHLAWRSQPRVGIPKGSLMSSLFIFSATVSGVPLVSSSFLLMLLCCCWNDKLHSPVLGRKVGQEMDTCNSKTHKF